MERGVSGQPNELLVPAWRSETMYGESVVFIRPAEGPAEAALLYAPDEVLAVASADGASAYVEGLDYRVDRAAGRIVRTPGSRMPEVEPDAIAAADGALTHARTVAVTYTHAAGWPGPPPVEAGTISRMPARLNRQEPLTICLTGDSISEGYDASGFHGVAPNQPGFGPLVTSELERRYRASVRLHNLGTAGWTSADAIWDTDRIVAAGPDLVVVAFGMNDACYADAGEFAVNVSELMSRVAAGAPLAEFVLVSPMLPTPECTWVVHDRFEEYRAVLADLVGDGVVLADVTGLWRVLLTRKHPHDLSGNGLNHPNDFGHRLYAQTILASLGA